MAGSPIPEMPDGRPLAEDVSPAGHLREYLYGEFEDDDLWEDDDRNHPDHCGACGGDSENGYPDCEFASLDCYASGPDQVDEDGRLVMHGCPRVVGAF